MLYRTDQREVQAKPNARAANTSTTEANLCALCVLCGSFSHAKASTRSQHLPVSNWKHPRVPHASAALVGKWLMMNLSQIVYALAAELRAPAGAPDPGIARVAAIRLAGPDALVFAEDAASFAAALASSAAAIIVPRPLADSAATARPLVIARQPKLAFARAAQLLAAAPPVTGIHPTAVIAPDALLAADVSIGPHAVIEAGARIGARTSIAAGAVIGAGVTLGEDCRIYPRVVIYPGATLGHRVVVHAGAVLGADGFGYVRDPASGEYLQFPQQGTLVIEDDVEIGANTTIDRGALEETRIARGVKIDNLVHLGHNVTVGRHTVIAALTGISGSTSIGSQAIIGGQVGIGDHAAIGDGVILGSQSGILPHKKVRTPGVLMWGTPAKPVKQYLRELATLTRLARASKQDEE
jgi:UDP-3-O-[3-hydroxymyristoyl] glucosamine N-acyltransferase